MNKFKIIVSVFFILLGLACIIFILTLNTSEYINRDLSIAINDGVAISMGIISGFSFLSSTLLLNSINKMKE